MYRLFNEILNPYALSCLLTLGACVNLWRRRVETRRRLLLITVPLAVMVVISLPLVAHVANGTLEWQFTPRTQLPEDSQALVVLGGWSMPADPQRPQPLLGEDSIVRCLHAAELYRRGGPCLVVVSGGVAEPENNQPPVAPLMRELLSQLGVPPKDVLVEDHSTSTYQNAQECQKILAEREIERITLVTDARHMLRATCCFRRLGFDVAPAPCDFRVAQFDFKFADFLPASQAAGSIGEVAHEWIGLAWYWLHGRI
jgi:uncharacterized SAM-binding protein YcdF (DUF218 family)